MRRSRYLAMMMVGVLAFAACGGDDDDSTASTQESADNTTDDTSDVADDTSGDDAVTEGDLNDIENAAGMFTNEECAAAVTAMIGAAAAAGTAFGGGDDSSLDDTLGLLDDYAKKAPDEIKDDLQTVADGYREFIQALQDSGYDPQSGEVPDADALQALDDASNSLDNSEFTDASDRVSAWFDTECAAG